MRCACRRRARRTCTGRRALRRAAQVEEFRPHIPLIVALRNPGMRDRHWDAISEQINKDLHPDESFTLTKVFDMGLPNSVEAISKVGERAAKEFQIECALSKMEAEWAEVDLFIDPYRETGTYIVKAVDDLQSMLDEHVTMTQAMQFSAFKKPFTETIDAWAKQLNTVVDVLDEWIKVQRSWLYLQPIFDSGDIQKQLPTEFKRFSTVDKNWRQTLAAAKAKPRAIKFCADTKLLEKFQESNKFLDLVQKGLSDYLETKRAAFARFYFLSNDELLEILSQTKDPTRVQPHLKKCFEGITRVDFSESLIISAMYSAEGERVEMKDTIDPKGKNVEVWMNEVERQMCVSVRKVLYDSLIEYLEIPRPDWVQKWPGQCVLGSSGAHWTREMEEAMNAKGALGVDDCYKQQLEQLQGSVALVRTRLSKLARVTLGALCVIDVHARDVTLRCVKARVDNVRHFEWISQMRYYWQNGEEGDMVVTMVTSQRTYGYEYLGNSLRLVVTPLTDKCYLTLMGALQMGLGGAPAGPAGTGKTETVKARARAVRCLTLRPLTPADALAIARARRTLPRRWQNSASYSTAPMAWTTSPWASFSRASRRAGRGRALTSSTASTSRCCPLSRSRSSRCETVSRAAWSA